MKSAGVKFIDGTTLTSVYDLNPVGTIIHSMLTEAQFSGQTGAAWVLADGRNVAGSKYAQIKGVTNVPDFRGYFLRGLDPTNSVDPSGSTRTLGSVQSGETKAHTHTYYEVGSANDPGSDVASYQAGPYQFHGSTRTSNSTGGSETRPINKAINYFIKIN